MIFFFFFLYMKTLFHNLLTAGVTSLCCAGIAPQRTVSHASAASLGLYRSEEIAVPSSISQTGVKDE